MSSRLRQEDAKRVPGHLNPRGKMSGNEAKWAHKLPRLCQQVDSKVPMALHSQQGALLYMLAVSYTKELQKRSAFQSPVKRTNLSQG